MTNKDENLDQKQSPEIEHIEWGRMTIKGYPEDKDFMLYPGGAEPWDWNKSKTRHVPGIQKQDIDYLVERGAKILILSKGMEDKLQTPNETKDLLEKYKTENNIEYHIETTLDAVKTYNKLVSQNKRVGALIHSTC